MQMDDIETPAVPSIEVGFTPVVHRDPATKTKYFTEALEIRCAVQDKMIVMNSMMSGANTMLERGLGTFIPYGLGKEKRNFYIQQIKNQNQYLHSLGKAVMFGIPREAMESNIPDGEDTGDSKDFIDAVDAWGTFKEFLKKAVNSDSGERLFCGIEATPSTDKLGKWIFLFDKKHSDEAHQFLEREFKQFFEAIQSVMGFSMLPNFQEPQKAGTTRKKMTDYASQIEARSNASMVTDEET